MRREERVTVQGPVKEQQPDGMSHRGGKEEFVYLKWAFHWLSIQNFIFPERKCFLGSRVGGSKERAIYPLLRPLVGKQMTAVDRSLHQMPR